MYRQVLFTLALLVVVGAAVWDAREWELKARLFPWVIGFPLLGMIVIQLALQLKGGSKPSRSVAAASSTLDVDPATARRRGLAIMGWILGFAGVVWAIGFFYGGPLATLAYLKAAGREKWPISLAISAVTLAAFWLMANLLNIPFPKGIVFDLIEA